MLSLLSCSLLLHSRASDVESEEHDVALLHDVVLALGARLALRLGLLLGAARDEVLVADGLGANETALKVRVDDAGGLRRQEALLDRPRLGLRLARGKVGAQLEEVVGLADELLEAGLAALDAELLEERRALLVVQIDQLRLDLRRDDNDRRALARCERPDLFDH